MGDNLNGKNSLFTVWSNGFVEVQFKYMNHSPFDDTLKRRQLAEKVAEFFDFAVSDHHLTKKPNFALARLVELDSCNRFLDAFNWALEQIKRHESGKKGASETNNE